MPRLIIIRKRGLRPLEEIPNDKVKMKLIRGSEALNLKRPVEKRALSL